MHRPIVEVLSWPVEEFEFWAAYYQVEPFGPWRDDLRIARLGALVASLGGRRKKLEVFMWKPPTPKPTEEDREAEHERKRRAFDWRAARDRFRDYTRRMGGQVNERKDDRDSTGN